MKVIVVLYISPSTNGAKMTTPRFGSIVVISGPSGVGKDTIINTITARTDFAKIPSCTTRPRRPNEVDGVHYHFLSEADFFALHRENKLLDHVVISGHHYGLLIESVATEIEGGQNIILHLVVGSAFLLKHVIPEAILIFIMPPSQQELIQRLQHRGMSCEEIQTRIQDDPTPLQAARYYDFVVVNHNGEEVDTATKILNFVHKTSTRHQSSDRLTLDSKPRKLNYMYPQFFATGNINKLREVNGILGKDLQQINIELFESQGVDVVEVIKEKAKDAFHKTGKLVLVEDTSLEFFAWGGLPGALVKWFLGAVGNVGLLKMLQNETNRQAIAKTAIGFYDGTKCHVFLGEIRGEIAKEVRGDGGFGWDPIFIPEGHTKSFAEMSPEEKNAVSMRRLAVVQLKEFFDDK